MFSKLINRCLWEEILLLPSVLVKWVLTALNNTYTSLGLLLVTFAAHASLDFPWLQHRIWIRQDARDAWEAAVCLVDQDKCPKGEFWCSFPPPCHRDPEGRPHSCLVYYPWSSHSQLLFIQGLHSPKGDLTYTSYRCMHPAGGKEGSISCSVWIMSACRVLLKDFLISRLWFKKLAFWM